jgi:hypothetical protein
MWNRPFSGMLSGSRKDPYMSYTPVPDTPLADTLVAMTAASIERSDLPDREIMIARVAALAAVGAPPISYTINAGLAAGTGLTVEDAQGILVAVAPVIGTARAGEAAVSITEGLGLALALVEMAEDGQS